MDPVFEIFANLKTHYLIIGISIECELAKTRGSSGLNRCRHTADFYKDEMYIFGGIEETDNNLNHLWRLNMSSDKSFDFAYS